MADDELDVPAPEVPPDVPPPGEEVPTVPGEVTAGPEEPAAEKPPDGASEPPSTPEKPVRTEEPAKKEEKPAETVDADGKKTKRKGSMFSEAKDAKELIEFAPGGDIQSTLQAFFKERSTSVENVPVKRLRRPKLVFENTFRLEPKKLFVSSRVEPIITKTLEELLENVKYNSKTVNTLGSHIAEKIRNRVLALEYDRFKVLVHVAIGTMSRQGVFMACKTVADPNRDSYAVGTYKNYYLYAVAVVHGLYYE